MSKLNDNKVHKEENNLYIKYEQYKNEKNINLKKFKHAVLKQTCKQYALKITGNKTVLTERIETLFKKIKNAIVIQSMIKRYQWKIFYNYRGPALNDRSKCCNTTDFVTLEPIEEIPTVNFFSYEDDQKFVYGFNICSLINLIRSGQTFENPYNRNSFSNHVKRNIIRVYNNNFFTNETFKMENKIFRRRNTQNLQRRRFIPHQMRNRSISDVNNYNPIINYQRYNTQNNQNRLHLFTERLQTIETIRTEPNVNLRIERLFMEIDRLGNYTSSSWFQNLSHMQYIRLYRCIYDIWTFRGQINIETRRQICPFYEPFDGIFPPGTSHAITYNDIKKACLLVFENIVYSSPDVEIRKIGALHCLSALTIVSHSARISMPYLYEAFH